MSNLKLPNKDQSKILLSIENNNTSVNTNLQENSNELINSSKNKSRNPTLVPISSMTPKFNTLYTKYMSNQSNIVYPNIRTLIGNYQAEKIKKLNQKDAIHEEIGEAIKKNKHLHDVLKAKKTTTLNQDYFSAEKTKTAFVKENRINILDSFNDFALSGQLTSRKKWKKVNDIQLLKCLDAKKMFQKKINRYKLLLKPKEIDISNNNKSDNNNNIKKMSLINMKRMKILKAIEDQEKTEKTPRKKLKIINDWKFLHKKLNFFCDNVNDDSERVKSIGKISLDKFNQSWTKYKKLQEFKFPETKGNDY